MENLAPNNKRIVKNTLLLYVRMLFLMVVSLYTSRVVLNALGIEDFGIYNVVGGMVAMFSILSGLVICCYYAIYHLRTWQGRQGEVEDNILFRSDNPTWLGCHHHHIGRGFRHLVLELQDDDTS